MINEFYFYFFFVLYFLTEGLLPQKEPSVICLFLTSSVNVKDAKTKQWINSQAVFTQGPKKTKLSPLLLKP